MSHLISSIVLLMVLSVFFVDGKPTPGEAKGDPMCKLPAVKGHCRALLQRWMYNSSTGKCEEFDFGGCDGNGNNFMTYKACISRCGGIS